MSSQPDARGEATGSPAPLERLTDIRDALRDFADERDWNQYHTPRNLLLALVGETGELSEIFQWKGEVSKGLPELTPEERLHAAEEMSDVLLYLVRLADVSGVDLGKAVADKMRKNAAKYPAQECRGSAAKYTELRNKAKARALTDGTETPERAAPSAALVDTPPAPPLPGSEASLGEWK